MICFVGAAQKIVVDTTSSNKYLLDRSPAGVNAEEIKEEELSFSDRAMSIGVGILNRLKARLNLEEASESLKEKKDKYLGKKEDGVVSEEEKKKEEG